MFLTDKYDVINPWDVMYNYTVYKRLLKLESLYSWYNNDSIENDKNFSSPSYINKVQSFAKLAETFRGLTELKTFKTQSVTIFLIVLGLMGIALGLIQFFK